MSAKPAAPCGCGCGRVSYGRFCRGHDPAAQIRPAGMSLTRALEIATAVFDAADEAQQARWRSRKHRGGLEPLTEVAELQVRRRSHGVYVNSGRTPGSRIPEKTVRAVLQATLNGDSTVDIALAFGVATRAVTRIRARARLLVERREA